MNSTTHPGRLMAGNRKAILYPCLQGCRSFLEEVQAHALPSPTSSTLLPASWGSSTSTCLSTVASFVGGACRVAACGLCGGLAAHSATEAVATRGLTVVTKLNAGFSSADQQKTRPFLGSWRNISTTGLDGYLRGLGVSWPERQLATRFRPQLSFSLVDGALQVLFPSPIGNRVEVLPIDKEVMERDPKGNEYVKRSYWDGSILVTVAKDVHGVQADVLTTRTIRASDGALVQTTTRSVTAADGEYAQQRSSSSVDDGGLVSFERTFVRSESRA